MLLQHQDSTFQHRSELDGFHHCVNIRWLLFSAYTTRIHKGHQTLQQVFTFALLLKKVARSSRLARTVSSIEPPDDFARLLTPSITAAPQLSQVAGEMNRFHNIELDLSTFNKRNNIVSKNKLEMANAIYGVTDTDVNPN